MPDRKDWLLMALAKAEDGKFTPVQAQKTMFLLAMEAKKHVGRNFYKFEPYDYGPFNSAIYSDLSELEDDEFVVVERSALRNWPTYVITKAGSRRAKAIAENYNAKAVEYLEQAVSWVKAQSFQSLLRALYAKYPEYAINSVFNK